MGCGSSKLETEEAVKRCKARKQFIRQTVAHRHAFAAAHASYAKSLKSTGAAIRQLADIESIPEGTAPASVAGRHSVSTLLPPPQPPEDHFSGPRTPLPRAASMPPILLKSQSDPPMKQALGSRPQGLMEDNEEMYEDQGFSVHKPTHSETLYDPFDNFPGAESSRFDTEDFELTAAGVDGDGVLEDRYQSQKPLPQVKRNVEGKGLLEREPTRKPHPVASVQQKVAKSELGFGTILRALDDGFFESYEASGVVSRLFEAKRGYLHTPYVDEELGMKEHNKVVSSILVWTSSSTGALLANDENDVDKLATTLDRLLGWETKLYDEVKAAEATRLELDRRSAQSKNLRGHEASTAVEKEKAHVKRLNTRYLVEIEAMDAALLEVKKLRDKSLYPQLLDLLTALKEMWKAMSTCHESQLPLIKELSKLPTPSTKESSESCKKITEDLEKEVSVWHDSLEGMLRFQKSCIMSLLDWSHLNVQQIESEVTGAADEIPADEHKEEVLLCDLCQAWADAVKHLSAEDLLQDLKHLAALLRVVAAKQSDEILQKKRKEDMHRDLEKKKKALDLFESKYKEKANPKEGQEYLRNPLQERRALVELAEKNAAEEEQRHADLCKQNSTMVFQSLKEGLPDVVYSVAAFAELCATRYEELYEQLTLDTSPSETSTSSR